MWITRDPWRVSSPKRSTAIGPEDVRVSGLATPGVVQGGLLPRNLPSATYVVAFHF